MPPQPPRPDASHDAAPRTTSRRDEVVRRILQADDFPAFSEVMSGLMSTLGDEEASVQRLANLVLRDYALTVKVIRTANTAHYNRTGRPVQSATHAMMLLGSRTLRELASGLLLFDHYRRKSPGLKELMLLSLLSASHARDAAARRGSADPETAQLCALFRNLGEVLVAGHLPQDYAEVMRETERRRRAGEGAVARAHAARQVLGCSFEDVGTAIARHWGMPDVVRRGMLATGATGEDALEVLAAFGNELTAAIYREETPASREAVTRVLGKYAGRLDLSRAVLAEMADDALAETREIFAAARVGLDDLRLERQITAAMRAGPLDGDETPARALDAPVGDGALARTPPAGAPAVGGDGEPERAPLRERLLAELAAAVPDAATYDLSSLTLVALEAALRGTPAERAIFCVPDAGVTELRARFALGPDADAARGEFRIGLDPARGRTGPTLLRGGEVVLDAGPRLAPPDAQLLRALGAGGAALLPVAVDGATIGCLYADRRAHTAPWDAATLTYLRTVAGALARGVEARRRHVETARAVAAAAPPAPTPTAAEKSEAVLRVLRGEAVDAVAASLGVAAGALERWHRDFLDGALARLGE